MIALTRISSLSLSLAAVCDSEMDASSRQSSAPLDPALVSASQKRLRRDKHQRSDRQRRAKTRETLDQLRVLVLPEAASKVEQAHIIAAAVDLIKSMREELSALRGGQLSLASQASPLQALVVETQSQLSVSALGSRELQRPPSPLLDLANAAREKEEADEKKAGLVVRAQLLPEAVEGRQASGWASFAKLKVEQERINQLRAEKQQIEAQLLSREQRVQSMKAAIKDDIERAMRMLEE